MKSLQEPALFWLDAGYYGWAGLQGDKQRLTSELDAVLRHSIPRHVILMDDARGLNGQNGAPTVPQLKQRIEAEFPGRSVEVKYDILRITPDKHRWRHARQRSKEEEVAESSGLSPQVCIWFLPLPRYEFALL